MRTLRLKQDTRYNRVEVELREDGQLKNVCAWSFKSPKHFRDAAATYRVDKDWLQAAVMKFLDAPGEPVDVEIPGPLAVTNDFVAILRGRLETADRGIVIQGEPLLVFREALLATCTAAEPLITWRDRSRLCAVDVDLNAAASFANFAPTLAPRPCFWWTTHGGGLRLIYAAVPPLTADELGAIASLAVRRRFPTARVELKADTRHPKYERNGAICGTVYDQPGDSDTSALAMMFVMSECTDEKRDAWLADRGLELTRRYAHDRCPIEPHEPGHRDPVHVCEGGIYCYACAGRGVRFGSRSPGYFPYVALAGDFLDSTLRIAVENFTHWAHFRYVLEEAYGLEESVGELVYRAALKLRHGVDPRIERAFAVGKDLLRLEQGWATAAGEPLTLHIENLIAELPAVQTAEGKVDPSRTTFFAQPSVDLTGYGYPALAPIWGARIASQFLDTHSFTKVFQTMPLRQEATRELRAKYLPERSRPMDEAAAWELVEEVFPEVNRNLVRLLLAARGTAELQAAMPPFLFISGPSSAGKTGTVMLAASIAGDTATSIQWQRQTERIRQGVMQAKANGSFVLLNEILKEGQRVKAGVEDTLDFILNMTPDSVSHRLYIGPVRLGWLPVVVLTDTVVPAELKQSKQLARRLIHAPLYRTVEWERTLQAIGRFDRFRLADMRYAQASNVILSRVIDDYFRTPATLKEIAADLGYHPLDAAPESMDNAAALRKFFDAVCAAPDSKHLAAGMSGRGWKVIAVFEETELSNLWRELGERKCTETAWGQLLGVAADVELEIRSVRSGRTYVRFVADRRTRKDYKVNREIVPHVDTVELATRSDEDSADRLGDAIDAKPAFGWLESLPVGFIDAPA